MQYASSLEEIEVIPTGLFLDSLSGIGGVPRGKILEIYGSAGVGKSTMTMQIIAEAQKQKLKCLLVDVEFSYTPRYGLKLGVSNEKLGIVRERCAEDILEAVIAEIDKWDLIVFDSVGALTPRAEIEKGVEGRVIGGQAGLMAKFCRKVIPLLDQHQTALILINHSFLDINSGFTKTSGGAKLNYAKSLSFELSPKGIFKSGEKVVGKLIKATVRKNKLADTEGQSLEVKIITNEGFNATADLMKLAMDKGIITKKGSTYWLNGETETKLGVGQEKVRKLLEEDEELLSKIKKLL